MKIKLHEKKEALEVVILGINKDPYRVNFHNYLNALQADIESVHLTDSEAYNLIVEYDGIKTQFLKYPNAQETADLFGVDVHLFNDVSYKSGLLNAANTTRIGNCCGVGEDIYVDPNEEN